MFVKIENHRNPKVCELVDVNDIKSVKVDFLIPEPTSPINPDDDALIDRNYIEKLKADIIEKFDYIDSDLVSILLGIDNESDMYHAMTIRGYDVGGVDVFAPSYRRYRYYLNEVLDYEKKVNAFDVMKSLTPNDDSYYIYTVLLKSTFVPIYTNKATFDNLTKVLCNQGCDSDVCNDNR